MDLTLGERDDGPANNDHTWRSPAAFALERALDLVQTRRDEPLVRHRGAFDDRDGRRGRVDRREVVVLVSMSSWVEESRWWWWRWGSGWVWSYSIVRVLKKLKETFCYTAAANYRAFAAPSDQAPNKFPQSRDAHENNERPRALVAPYNSALSALSDGGANNERVGDVALGDGDGG
ncbi:hypothetical protein AG1IA_06497 [Rhizoctonia solani AG-1 IA]|uniref:Uncharacterized protein n=1 Tax=Thanatephorus cucumeris (strain AG1-IA) TaxID=983506 RepID=L8WSW1_THACA|nr:hypothetical protein AG1IA_06497 [Rhizoctonia solani AG-1 IA]